MPKSPEAALGREVVTQKVRENIKKLDQKYSIDRSLELAEANQKLVEAKKRLKEAQKEYDQAVRDWMPLNNHETERQEWGNLSDQQKEKKVRDIAKLDLLEEAYDRLVERYRAEQFQDIPVVVYPREGHERELANALEPSERSSFFGSTLEGELKINLADELVPNDEQDMSRAVRVDGTSYYYLSTPGAVEPGRLVTESELGEDFVQNEYRVKQFDAEERARVAIYGEEEE